MQSHDLRLRFDDIWFFWLRSHCCTSFWWLQFYLRTISDNPSRGLRQQFSINGSKSHQRQSIFCFPFGLRSKCVERISHRHCVFINRFTKCSVYGLIYFYLLKLEKITFYFKIKSVAEYYKVYALKQVKTDTDQNINRKTRALQDWKILEKGFLYIIRITR